MTVTGTLPFDRMYVTVMPTGSHERDMGDTVKGHSAVCAMAIPFTAWKHMQFTVEQVGRSTKSPQYTHRARTACALRAHRVCTARAPRVHRARTAISTPSCSHAVQKSRLWLHSQCSKLKTSPNHLQNKTEADRQQQRVENGRSGGGGWRGYSGVWHCTPDGCDPRAKLFPWPGQGRRATRFRAGPAAPKLFRLSPGSKARQTWVPRAARAPFPGRFTRPSQPRIAPKSFRLVSTLHVPRVVEGVGLLRVVEGC